MSAVLVGTHHDVPDPPTRDPRTDPEKSEHSHLYLPDHYPRYPTRRIPTTSYKKPQIIGKTSIENPFGCTASNPCWPALKVDYFWVYHHPIFVSGSVSSWSLSWVWWDWRSGKNKKTSAAVLRGWGGLSDMTSRHWFAPNSVRSSQSVAWCPGKGLEPSRREALVSKTSVSTNSTTWACAPRIRKNVRKKNNFLILSF